MKNTYTAISKKLDEDGVPDEYTNTSYVTIIGVAGYCGDASLEHAKDVSSPKVDLECHANYLINDDISACKNIPLFEKNSCYAENSACLPDVYAICKTPDPNGCFGLVAESQEITNEMCAYSNDLKNIFDGLNSSDIADIQKAYSHEKHMPQIDNNGDLLDPKNNNDNKQLKLPKDDDYDIVKQYIDKPNVESSKKGEEHKKLEEFKIFDTRQYDKNGTNQNYGNLSNTLVTFDELKKKENRFAVGSIYVYPTYQDGGVAGNFRIPFQFNPMIQESGKSAKYEAMTMLQRQGAVQSYINTEGETVSIETNYIITTSEKGASDSTNSPNPEGDLLSAYTPKFVQLIELAYRSLVLPQSGKNSNNENYFLRPPIIKVVFGKKDATDTGQLYPMLTHPIGTKMVHRTFLASKVNITKDINTMPVIIENGNMINTIGFKVNVDLIEIDPNYIGVMPRFGEYYSAMQVYKDADTNLTLNVQAQ